MKNANLLSFPFSLFSMTMNAQHLSLVNGLNPRGGSDSSLPPAIPTARNGAYYKNATSLAVQLLYSRSL